MNRALAEGRLHEYSQAIADYSALIQVAPNNVTAYYNRAVIHRYNGEKDLARADLHTVQRMTNDVATLQQVERQLQILAAP